MSHKIVTYCCMPQTVHLRAIQYKGYLVALVKEIEIPLSEMPDKILDSEPVLKPIEPKLLPLSTSCRSLPASSVDEVMKWTGWSQEQTENKLDKEAQAGFTHVLLCCNQPRLTDLI